jgi:predicted nucleic acid-binding protein
MLGTSPRGWLLDKSALARSPDPAVKAALVRLLEGSLFTCAVIELEVLYSARNARDYRELAADRRLRYGWAEMDAETWSRALRLQSQLADRSHLRAAGSTDLLVAATAQQHDLVVLHYDRDFETLGRLCGVKEQAIVPLGSIN